MCFLFVGNMKISCATFVHSRATGIFRIEMVLTRLSRENLAVLRDFEAFCV